MTPGERNRRIWQVVAAIPAGRVMGYGEVARRAGLGRAARMVGKALQAAPKDMALPWHRVLCADGRIAFPKGSKPYSQQCRKLRAEGVAVKDGRVKRASRGDKAALDKLLWSVE